MLDQIYADNSGSNIADPVQNVTIYSKDLKPSEFFDDLAEQIYANCVQIDYALNNIEMCPPETSSSKYSEHLDLLIIKRVTLRVMLSSVPENKYLANSKHRDMFEKFLRFQPAA